uniref:Uncharacterized protein n=1 Tax=Anguilla anguilla TaxID=7936 RepID=A0A0E9TDF1_ANGAN
MTVYKVPCLQEKDCFCLEVTTTKPYQRHIIHRNLMASNHARFLFPTDGLTRGNDFE